MFFALRIPCTDALDAATPKADSVSATPEAATPPTPTAIQAIASPLPKLLLPKGLRELGLTWPRRRRLPAGRTSLVESSPGLNEVSTYDVTYGFLGTVGQLSISTGVASKASDGVPILQIHGEGGGEVFGLGKFERSIETEVDLAAKQPRRWRAVRHSESLTSRQTIVDSVQRNPGDALSIERRKGDSPTPTSTETLIANGFTADPLGLIWRLRHQTLTEGEAIVLQMLDGVALWRIDGRVIGVSVAVPESSRLGIQIDAVLTPIMYNGQPDPVRSERRFRLWLDTALGQIPLRLEMPIGVADAVLKLKESRPLVAAAAATR